MAPKISIIVPVYKAEAYIRRCIDSILAQTLTDFELLLIDDGSPDGSGEICDTYAATDSRIRVFHKENGGVGSARQFGLDNAIGEYTIHADPDDWVDSTMLEELYYKAIEDQADMVLCDYWLEYPNHQEYQSLNIVNTNCVNLISKGNTGDIFLKNVIATEKFLLESDTGNIEFEASDAHDIFIKTDTGDVKGSFITDKVIFAESNTGNIDVPKITSDEKCEIITDTGDIKITIDSIK